jgi:ferric-dicitrate binding protein FerR (iron transport regulator)
VPDSKFEVHSATAVASMRATEWVAETFPGTTHLVVMRGAVAVTSTDPTIAGSVILEAGEGTKVDAGAAPAAKGRWGQNRVRSFEEQTALD